VGIKVRPDGTKASFGVYGLPIVQQNCRELATGYVLDNFVWNARLEHCD